MYDLENMCGVEIMPNCGGLRCEDVCQSHHDCDQFAEMANVCVNMKNISETDNCVVKLRPNLTLYRLQWNCWILRSLIVTRHDFPFETNMKQKFLENDESFIYRSRKSNGWLNDMSSNVFKIHWNIQTFIIISYV